MSNNGGVYKKIKQYLKAHVGEQVPRKVLDELVGHSGDWPRSARKLRDEGYELIVTKGKGSTYCLTSVDPVKKPKGTRSISKKLRSEVIIRDNSTCQMCGRNVVNDEIKIQIDHIIPYSWGGETIISNLQCLCSDCDEGKKAWEQSEDPELMKEINAATSTKERLRLYFEYYVNKNIDVHKLEVIAKTRDWTRVVRRLRKDYKMDIEYIHSSKLKKRMESYVYHLPNHDNQL